MATKHGVNLYLNTENYNRARELLERVPGQPSVSSLVDQMLEEFVQSVGPKIVDAFESGNLLSGMQSMTVEAHARIAKDSEEAMRIIRGKGESKKTAKK